MFTNPSDYYWIVFFIVAVISLCSFCYVFVSFFFYNKYLKKVARELNLEYLSKIGWGKINGVYKNHEVEIYGGGNPMGKLFVSEHTFGTTLLIKYSSKKFDKCITIARKGIRGFWFETKTGDSEFDKVYSVMVTDKIDKDTLSDVEKKIILKDILTVEIMHKLMKFKKQTFKLDISFGIVSYRQGGLIKDKIFLQDTLNLLIDLTEILNNQ